MPQISTILQDEQQNNGAHIRLYAEGVFYKAYERSAWVACRVLHPFMVKKRAVRKVGQEVVSIGFPKASLSKWAGTRRVEPIGDDCVVIYMNDDEALPFAADEYEAWKAGIDLAVKEAVNEPEVQQTAAVGTVEAEVCQAIRRFPIESKNPIECMLFVAELKRMLQT